MAEEKTIEIKYILLYEGKYFNVIGIKNVSLLPSLIIVFITSGLSDRAHSEIPNVARIFPTFKIKYTKKAQEEQQAALNAGTDKAALEKALYEAISDELTFCLTKLGINIILIGKSAGGAIAYLTATKSRHVKALGLQAPAPGIEYRWLRIPVFLGWQKCDTKVDYTQYYKKMCESLKKDHLKISEYLVPNDFKSSDCYSGDNHVLQLEFINDALNYFTT